MIDYEEKRMIFEIEAKMRQVDLTRYKLRPEIYKHVATRRLWEMFVRGLDIAESLSLEAKRFEEEAFKRYGTTSSGMQVMFKVRKAEGA